MKHFLLLPKVIIPKHSIPNISYHSAWIFLYAVAVSFTIGCTNEDQSWKSSFEIHPDFQIELVAKEPLVFDPVDMEFDEHGRAFVIEMPGYPFPLEKGRVIMLTDENKDGVFDKRTVYIENMGIASSILPYRGGLLIASPPDLLFVKDTDGDNMADEREVLLTGFAVDNQQHNYNGLTHGLDNWIYGVNGGNSGNVSWSEDDDTVHLRRNDFRFHLDDSVFEITGRSSGGFELAMDSWGRTFETHNTRHISHLVFPEKYLSGLSVSPSHTLDNISDHDHDGLARVYPIGIQESRVNHPEQSGFFSGSCGITYYGGGAFPKEFNDNFFVCDVVLNLIHRDVIKADGVTMQASRGQEKSEFLASSDRAFRPVNMTVGPDGALYVLDMHRTVIEHPEWIPDEIEEVLNLNAGKDKGRIYKITPKGGLPNMDVHFDRNKITDVVANLGHENKWWRDTAQRLLIEWQDENSTELLQVLFNDSNNPLARLHALWTLYGLKGLKEETLIKALHDSDAVVREHAIKIAEQSFFQNIEIVKNVIAMATDDNPKVRSQTALSISTLNQDIREEFSKSIHQALFNVISRDINDPWARLAIVSGLKNTPLTMVKKLLTEPSKLDKEALGELLGTLAIQVGKSHNQSAIESILSDLITSNKLYKIQVIKGLSDGWNLGSEGIISPVITNRIESTLSSLENIVDINNEIDVQILTSIWSLKAVMALGNSRNQVQILTSVRELVRDSTKTDLRLQQLALLEFGKSSDNEQLLFDLLDTREPKVVQLGAMTLLSKTRDSSVGKQLVAHWETLGPDARKAASNILLYQKNNHELLIASMEKGLIKLGEMNLDLERRRTLLNSSDKSIQARAKALFSDAGVVTRKDAIENMRPALSLTGSSEKGAKVFNNTCFSCHQMGNIGSIVGPNLTEIYRKSPEQLLFDILDPNAAVDTEFINHTIQTTDGEIINGIISTESDKEVVFLGMNGVETHVLRRKIESLKATGLSFMPEGMEAGLSHQDMADLLAYLQERR